MKVFEYVAVFVPKKDSAEKARIIVGPAVVLAKDDKEALLKAARAVPEDYVEKLDQVDIAVRPF